MENFVSFTGIVTFPKAIDVKKSATLAPENRIMIETDSPYLSPIPFRGKRCEPAYVRHTAEHIAELRETTLEKFAETTFKNAETFFRITENYK
jgi:TatD DNase family protein